MKKKKEPLPSKFWLFLSFVSRKKSYLPSFFPPISIAFLREFSLLPENVKKTISGGRKEEVFSSFVGGEEGKIFEKR